MKLENSSILSLLERVSLGGPSFHYGPKNPAPNGIPVVEREGVQALSGEAAQRRTAGFFTVRRCDPFLRDVGDA